MLARGLTAHCQDRILPEAERYLRSAGLLVGCVGIIAHNTCTHLVGSERSMWSPKERPAIPVTDADVRRQRVRLQQSFAAAAVRSDGTEVSYRAAVRETSIARNQVRSQRCRHLRRRPRMEYLAKQPYPLVHYRFPSSLAAMLAAGGR